MNSSQTDSTSDLHRGEVAQLVHHSGVFDSVQPHFDHRALHVNITEGLRPFLVGEAANGRLCTVVVMATGREAADMHAHLSAHYQAAVELYPSWETLPHERLSPAVDTVGQRLKVEHLLNNLDSPLIVITTVRSFIQPTPSTDAARSVITLRTDTENPVSSLAGQLTDLAYERVDMVSARGQFAVRGGIIDIFPSTSDYPVRVEYWDDDITDMRQFSVADQRSLPDTDVQQLDIYPCRELLLTEDVKARAARLASTHQDNPTLVELLEKLSQGVYAPGMEALISALVPNPSVLFSDKLPQDALVVVCDGEKVRRRATDLVSAGKDFLEASWSAGAMGEVAAPIDSQTLDLSATAYRTYTAVSEHVLESGRALWQVNPPGFALTEEGEKHIEIAATGAPMTGGKPHALDELFASFVPTLNQGRTIAIVLPGKGTCQRIVERLTEANIPATFSTSFTSGVVNVYAGTLVEGFIARAGEDHELTVLSEACLTGTRIAGGVKKSRPAKRRAVVDPLALNAGDLVVHDRHGIGKFVEMMEREVKVGSGTSRREYLVLDYAPSKRGGPPDRLLVPMESLDQLSRYVGGEAPSLSKMGGSDWKNAKTKARKAVREIAHELVELYAKRQASPGHAFAADSPWQAEMEDAFAFTETQDQLTVIADVKEDMEKPVPMDRVVIGDVGYGKTEVAVRAAFKAVQDGKQVAVLVPTTLLAGQHLQTFSQRMTGFPVRVQGLSRFTSPADAKKIMADIGQGEVDIVIGTHRLLSNSISWKNLGLVIIDEEQRFGVEHKEHIKALRAHVDMLTMSATPIPRTLEMSMVGIREMSTILTPPEERLPVLTYVGPHADKQVAAAIRRELLRDGQVFYVHNKVRTIDATAEHIRQLVPEARVVVAHGQMNEETLEKTVDSFWQRDCDVLVCTTIIETGLDISNANTLIVDRADQLGLSQLHQLRGRVGRSRERGYAYFLYPSTTPLSETAYDRLSTIASNNELGAGMAVAMKDLELRGAGNVLGSEQSGHVAGVGFDLYVRLVGEAVEAYRAIANGETVKTEEEVKDIRIELPIDAHIPAGYVNGERLRLEAYRKLASAHSDEDITAVITELHDRYGDLPTEVKRLVALAKLRGLCRQFGVYEVVQAGTKIRIGPLQLPDSLQVRLKRLYPTAVYRPAPQLVLIPVPKTTGAVLGSSEDFRAKDVQLAQYVADFVLAMNDQPQGSCDIQSLAPIEQGNQR